MSSTSNPSGQPTFHVAIIGAGIVGLTLGIGLQARNVDFTIYERANEFREVGAAIGLSPNAEWAMKLLDKRIHDAYEKVANPNGEDLFQFVNGLTKESIFKLPVGAGCFRGCRRSDLLDELIKLVPAERIKFGKQLQDVAKDGTGKLGVKFKDGTTESTDAVIGCDGIRSSLREIMFRDDSQAYEASYSQKFSFRTLIPMDQARKSLGDYMCSTRFMYNGPGAHIITYPVARSTLLNTLAVVSDANPWHAEGGKHTGTAVKSDATNAFEEWNPSIRAIAELFPETMDKWAIFDMLDNPVPSYTRGKLCLAGDAAHATGPHLGAGAGFGIEDALVLSELLDAVNETTVGGSVASRDELVQTAFLSYNAVRYERTQWLIKHTRDAVDLFHWKEPEIAKDTDIFGKEITWRFHEIWYYDIGEMVKEALGTLLEGSKQSE